jgi:tetratricopeptide (TPR) repeat protein
MVSSAAKKPARQRTRGKHYDRGRTLQQRRRAFRSENYDAAVSDFKAALQLNRNHGELRYALCVVYNNMGIDYAEKKAFDRAVTYFGAALKLSPNDAETKRNLERVEAAVKGETEKRAREETERKRAESRKMLLGIWNRLVCFAFLFI